MTLAERLRRLLDAQGYTPSEAARAAGMPRQQLHRILTGANPNPGVETLRKVCEAVGSRLAELFADDGAE